jgi:hypothetical protein
MLLQAYTNELLIVGVTRRNLDWLLARKPLRIEVLHPVKNVVLVFGETKLDIVAQLEAAGVELEQTHKDAFEADPE